MEQTLIKKIYIVMDQMSLKRYNYGTPNVKAEWRGNSAGCQSEFMA